MLWDQEMMTTTSKHSSSALLLGSMDNNGTFQSTTNGHLDQYHADLQSMVDSYVTSVDSLSPIRPTSTAKSRRISPLKIARRLTSNSSSSLVTFDRDPASTESNEHLTDELRWLLIQYGPHQPRDDGDNFLASALSTSNGKGNIRFRAKWFDDVRFSDWLEYSPSTGRAYCFYCRLFADSNRNRAFSRDGIKNWRKCLGSRGQKKKRSSLKSDEDNIVSQRRGLLESHALSESHKQAYNKYVAFVDHMHFEAQPIGDSNDSKETGTSNADSNLLQHIKEENIM